MWLNPWGGGMLIFQANYNYPMALALNIGRQSIGGFWLARGG
jgi:hypothetical protein